VGDGGYRLFYLGSDALFLQMLSRLSLPSVSLACFDLGRGSFEGVDFEQAFLVGSSLVAADLAGSNLRDARLDFANLTDAVLSAANVSGASFRNAIIEEA
jgi:uncharacterized protein YjbI with pentapeptide repeats